MAGPLGSYHPGAIVEVPPETGWQLVAGGAVEVADEVTGGVVPPPAEVVPPPSEVAAVDPRIETATLQRPRSKRWRK